jgi:hypothetical protein
VILEFIYVSIDTYRELDITDTSRLSRVYDMLFVTVKTTLILLKLLRHVLMRLASQAPSATKTLGTGIGSPDRHILSRLASKISLLTEHCYSELNPS